MVFWTSEWNCALFYFRRREFAPFTLFGRNYKTIVKRFRLSTFFWFAYLVAAVCHLLGSLKKGSEEMLNITEGSGKIKEKLK